MKDEKRTGAQYGNQAKAGNKYGAARRTYPLGTAARGEDSAQHEDKPYRGNTAQREDRPYRGNTAQRTQNRAYRADKAEDYQSHAKPYAKRTSAGPRVGAIYDNVPSAVRISDAEPEIKREVAAPAPIEENECMLVGRNPIREALKSGRTVEKLLVAQGDLSGAARDIVRMARDAGAVVQSVDRSRLDQIYPAHQGMLAYVSAVEYCSLEDIFAYAQEKGEDAFIVVLDGVTDPHNLGAIIRSAECAGAHGVVIPERRAAGLGPAAAKAAAGALNYMHIARVKNLNRAIDEMKQRGAWVIGTAMDGEDALTADLSGALALVIGSEGDGISRLTLEKCDRTLTLPMKGQIESLNASVAAGILMYEVLRARVK